MADLSTGGQSRGHSILGAAHDGAVPWGPGTQRAGDYYTSISCAEEYSWRRHHIFPGTVNDGNGATIISVVTTEIRRS